MVRGNVLSGICYKSQLRINFDYLQVVFLSATGSANKSHETVNKCLETNEIINRFMQQVHQKVKTIECLLMLELFIFYTRTLDFQQS